MTAAMVKSELILRIAYRNPHLSERDVERVVHTILDRISDALVAGDRVELRGFGVFSLTEWNARTGRNPKTREAVAVETKRLPVFKTGRAMHARLNPSGIVTGGELDDEVELLLRAS